MIGSLMSRMGMAEKLSIPQLQKAIQDGTLPAYVGVPLLQQRMQEQKQAQAAAMGQAAQQPTIAQQVMGEAQGIEQAQSNLPAEGFAPGGIIGMDGDGYAGGGMVAFASGDLVDDDEEDDDSTADYFDRLSAVSQAEQEGLLNQYAAQGVTEGAPQGISGINLDRPTGVGIRPEAQAPRGLEALEARVIRQESGGRDFDKNGNPLTSPKGAKYAMQVMPATARDPGFGITPAKNDSPEEYNRVGRELLSKLYQKYNGDEQLTLAAYNWGSGNVDKYLKAGRDISMVPKETRQYASMAQGGIASIKHFFKGGDNNPAGDSYGYVGFGEEVPASDTPSDFMNWWNRHTYGTKEYFMANTPSMDPTKPEGGAVPYVPGTDDTYDPELNTASRGTPMMDEIAAQKELDARAELEKKKEAEKKVEAESPAAMMQKYLDEVRANIKQQREQDRYMALLAGGLGMMGGTSPHALANVGQGGMKGVEALLAANKITGAQENAAMKGQLGAYQLQQNQETRKALAADAQKKDAYGKMGVIRNNVEKNVIAEMKLDPIAIMDDPKLKAKLAQEVERRLSSSPEYRGLHELATGLKYDYGLAGNTPAAPVNYQGLYSLTPRKS